MNLQSRLTALEESTADGYRTYDADGQPVIQSDLPTFEWMLKAKETLRNGTTEQKEILRDQLARSVRANDGGRLFELIRVMDHGPVECTTDAPIETRAGSGVSSEDARNMPEKKGGNSGAI